jgi:monoamine oxidase
MTKTRVLILGGGFGGLYAALEFEKRSDPDFEVTLVSEENFFLFRGAHTKRKKSYGKELSARGVECECTQKERSTSITKQLVFQYPFCRKTSCNRVLGRFLLVE